MTFKYKYTAFIAGLAMILGSCGGEKTVEDALLCQELNYSTYVAEPLGEGGRTQTGIAYMHWRAEFKDYSISLWQSDFVLSGKYRCEGGKILASWNDTPEHSIPYASDLSSLSLHPFKDKPLTYLRAKPNWDESYKSCELVRGNRYVEETSASALVPIDRPIPYGIDSYSFGEQQQVEYTVGGDAVVSGIYECGAGALHVHSSPEDAKPQIITVSKSGESIQVKQEGSTRKFVKQKTDPGFCTEEFAPVCAVKLGSIQCITTPCPAGLYATYSNQCKANLDKAKVLFKESCGDLEGKPYFEDEPSCDAVYKPVIGAQTLIKPCLTEPCPAVVHKSYSNICEAKNAKSRVLFEGECGKKEGTPVETIEGACIALYDPVCAKTKSDVVCVKAPCPTHEYKTFGNSCNASMALASTVFDDACGTLENSLVFAEPPIKIVDKLPKTSKNTVIDNVSIENDILKLSLAYSGCSEQHFNFSASKAFKESNPVQIDYVFTPMVEDQCEAYFVTNFAYDLLPLKHTYQNAYQAKSGKINLPGIGVYSF